MLLTFIREEYSNYSPEEGVTLEFCWGYTIYQNEELFGYFFFDNHRSYVAFDDRTYRFECKFHFFKKSEYFVTDLSTNERCAVTFTIPSIHWFLEKPYQVMSGKETFRLYSQDPDIRFRLFNSDTWWWEKFSLLSDANWITYQMQTTRAALYASRVTEGTIESSCDNFLVIAAGLYLHELWRVAHSE